MIKTENHKMCLKWLLIAIYRIILYPNIALGTILDSVNDEWFIAGNSRYAITWMTLAKIMVWLACQENSTIFNLSLPVKLDTYTTDEIHLLGQVRTATTSIHNKKFKH